MAKPTFYHLSEEKRQQIIDVCKKEFEQNPIGQAKVSSIVETLGIARGSFYQYFEDIEECYFTILKQETFETHELFSQILTRQPELFSALELYGQTLAEELFKPERYALYRNRYLFWTPVLDEKWKIFCGKTKALEGVNFPQLNTERLNLDNPAFIPELILYLKAIVHELIRRLFVEKWTADIFLKHYRLQMTWLKNGLCKN